MVLNRWFDSHCHLDFPQLAGQLPQVLARARMQGVVQFVVPGVKAAHWPRVLSLTSEPGVSVACGIHPWFVVEHQQSDLEALDAWLGDSDCVAVGECGLDYARKEINRDVQRFFFDAQLKLAQKHRLPVIVHACRALDDVLQMLARHPEVKAVLHGFSGTPEQALRACRAGHSLGIGGAVTRANHGKLRRVVREMPAGLMLLETDAPEGVWASGDANEPALLVETAAVVADLRQVSLPALSSQVMQNSLEFFGLSEVE